MGQHLVAADSQHFPVTVEKFIIDLHMYFSCGSTMAGLVLALGVHTRIFFCECRMQN